VSEVFAVSALIKEVRENYRYHEFLRVPAMSAGICVFPKGGIDSQTPHKEDEIYYVVRGQSKMIIGAEQRPVRTGDVILVDAGVEHRFTDIEQKLVLLVIFAPAESS